MKYYRRLTIIGIFALGLAGCSSEEAKESVVPEEQEVETETEKVEVVEVEEESVQEDKAEMDTVYGALDIDSYKKESDMMYRDVDRNVLYLLADDQIFQAEVILDGDLGVNVDMDLPFLTGHAMDYMAEDASLIQTKSATEFVYESKQLGKKYDVLYASDTGNNVITRVIVSQHIE
ncbi:hypothetical protein [Psychrobacillus sp. NPDC093180]|uniref:hypothetical protein n=1 Tax=Psychrobacillus sp. NPDC093180 TaxID=3364489 RepID=UPI0038055081